MKTLHNYLMFIVGFLFSTKNESFAMAIIDTVATFEGEDAGFFLKPVTENPLITDLGFDVIDGALVDQFIYLNSELDKVTKVYTGCGAKTDTELGANITRKLLSPVKLEIYKTQCADAFDDTVFRKQIPAGVDAGNLTGGQIKDLLLSFLNPVVTRDALRILLLGDTALADPNYNQINGLFQKLGVGVTSDGIVDAGAITDSDLTVANIQATLQRVRDARTRKLRQVPKADQAIWVTDSVFDAWQEFLETNANLESARLKLIDGQDVTSYHGVKMIPWGLVDEYLEADFSTGSPAVITGEHRIVWTMPKNHVMAIDTVAKYNQVIFDYDPRDDINWFKVRYMLDYNYKYPDLITIAGF